MKTCFILVGVSGSGKSTVRDQLVMSLNALGHNDIDEFSLDDCRVEMFSLKNTDETLRGGALYAASFEYANNNKTEFNDFVNSQWATALKSSVVIVDNTNLTRKSRARWIKEARAKGFEIVAIQVMAPLQVVIDRQKTRGDKAVPEHVVRDMYLRQQEVLAGDEADGVISVDGTTDQLIKLINALL